MLSGVQTLNVVQTFAEEVEIMSRIEHPNILRCRGASLTPPSVFIMMVSYMFRC